MEDFKKEVLLMNRLSHENIVEFHGCVTTPNVYMVLELASRGALYNCLASGFAPLDLHGDAYWGEAPKPPGLFWTMCRSIARGMHYLHTLKDEEGRACLPTLHRDLKSANILVSVDYTCKISDFGLTQRAGRYL